eukprot:gene13391-13507_t
MADVSLPAAALAGLLSFLSPCVLPLVPPYLCFIAGTTLEELESEAPQAARRDILLAGMLFVAGFSAVFVSLGATASAFGAFIRSFQVELSWAAGLAIVLMGLHFLGVFRIGLFYREARVQVQKPGLGSAFLMGLAFAFGWTPCIGPILATILAVASSEASVAKGAVLLLAYSFGLGIPFMLAALMMGPFMAFMVRFRRYFGIMEKIVGGLLVLTGIAFLTGSIQSVSFWLLDLFPGLAKLG